MHKKLLFKLYYYYSWHFFFFQFQFKTCPYGKMFEAWPDIFYSNIPWVVLFLPNLRLPQKSKRIVMITCFLQTKEKKKEKQLNRSKYRNETDELKYRFPSQQLNVSFSSFGSFTSSPHRNSLPLSFTIGDNLSSNSINLNNNDERKILIVC